MHINTGHNSPGNILDKFKNSFHFIDQYFTISVTLTFNLMILISIRGNQLAIGNVLNKVPQKGPVSYQVDL